MRHGWLVSFVVVAACSTQGPIFTPDGAPLPGEDASADVIISVPESGLLDVQPEKEQVITVAIGQQSPTVSYAATYGGSPASVGWRTDRGETGVVASGPSSTTVFVPSGTTGGLVGVEATLGQETVSRAVLVKLTGSQNGATPNESSQVASSTGQLLSGGGVGGVGGEGLGGAVSDMATLTALASPSQSGNLAWLYPYDKTVWPRGILAPLLQWSSSIGDADAIKIDLTTSSGSFSWSGTFARPAILMQTNGKFIRSPIPQDIWAMATNTAGNMIDGKRDHLVVTLTIALNGQGYGPIAETWDVAPGRLSGTVYYQSYGTKLATSSWGMGAATLAINPGATDPVVITSKTRCQACHGVNAEGSTLVTLDSPAPSNPTQDQDLQYDLKASTVGNLPGPGDQYTWGALNPDGTMLFSNSAPKWGTQGSPGMEASVQTPSKLFSLPSGSAMNAVNLPNNLGSSMPVFSPDGKHIAFNFYTGGPGIDNKSADGASIATIDFDPMTKAFSSLRTLYTPSSCPGCVAVWPTYLPTSNRMVFELQTASDGYEIGGDSSATHYVGQNYQTNTEGTRGELWWLDVATKTAHRLDAANGKGYVPAGPNEHNDDTTLHYQPTVAPVSSGGYAWVVFLSRRLYGSIATMNPWWSDTQVSGPWFSQPMTKKLWVAAIDLNAPPGTDASHPAFYLPAQELLAGNSRGYWVLDPCRVDGKTCDSGDQCCGGYCGPSADGGGLVCAPMKQGCKSKGDKCTQGSDCCTGLACTAGHCDVTPW